MKHKEYFNGFDDFDEESQQLLLSLQQSVIPMNNLQSKGYSKFQDIKMDNVQLGETIRGMKNVSPLVEIKFNNQTSDEIFGKYFPDATNTQKGYVNVIEDINLTIKNGYKFNAYNYYFDNNQNGIFGDSGDALAFRLLLFVSDDGNKVKECFEVVKPADDEVILFLESDKDNFSKDVLYGRMSEKVRKQFTDDRGNLKSNLFDSEIMKAVKKHANLNQKVVEELMKKGYIENKSIAEGFFIFLKYVMMGISAPAKALGWTMNKLGEGIDFLKIPDQFWDTEDENYLFQKDKLKENLSISTDKTGLLKNLFTDRKGFNLADLTPQMLDDIILKQIGVAESFVGNYNAYVKNKVEEIFKTLENPTMQQQTENLAEKVALICGIWNGLVDFVSSVLKFFGSLLEAPFDVANDFQHTLEMVDNFWDLLKSGTLWDNLETAISAGITKMLEYLKSKNANDVNWVRIHYVAGFAISFIGTFFIPIADIAKIGEVGKVGEILAKINEEVGKTISQTSKFVKIKSAEAYQNIGKALEELLEMLAKGGQKLDDFVENLWKKIADWFLENKEKVEGIAKKIKDALSKDGKTEEFFRKIDKKFNLAGDEILSSSDIKKLRRLLLETFDVALEFVDQNPALKAKLKDWTARRVAGSFNKVEGVMYLRKSVTAYTVQHEMFHMKLWYKMTKEFPELQPLFQKTLGRQPIKELFHEEYVLAEFMKNPSKWKEADLLNDLENINKLRKELELPVANLEYYKKWNLEQELLKFK